MQRIYWVYILENPVGRFYIGSTSDLLARLRQHNADKKVGTKFTHKHGPWTLVWQETHADRSSAMKREKQIKSMKSAKWIRDQLLSSKELEIESEIS